MIAITRTAPNRPYPFPADAGIEPLLCELLADPVLHAVLRRDGLTVEDVLHTVRDWHLARMTPAAA